MDQIIPHLGWYILLALFILIFGGSAWAYRDAKKRAKGRFR